MKRTRISVWTMLGMAMVCLFLPIQSGAQAPEKVFLSQNVLNFSEGGEVNWGFEIKEPATVDALLYNSDHVAVRVLAKDKAAPAGTNFVQWDGLDDAGNPLPDGAYYITLTGKTENGSTWTYDPWTVSGGEKIPFMPGQVQFDASAGVVRVELPQPARVQLRAGIFQGPLLVTVLDWTAKPAGAFTVAWDGMDDGDLLKVAELENYNLQARAYALPDNAIILENSPAKPLAPVLLGDRNPQERGEWLARKEQSLERNKAVQAALSQARYQVEPHARLAAGKGAAPEFKIALVDPGRGGAPIETKKKAPRVSGLIGIQVTLSDTSRARLQQQRFEIVNYVDYQLVGEQEQGYSPYTLLLDTTDYPNGLHTVTINVAGLQDQLNAQSIQIDINN